MGIKHQDADGVTWNLEVEDGAGGTKRLLHGVPSTIATTFTAIKTAVEAVSAIIAGGKLATTNAVLEALITSSRLATSNSALEALIASSRLATSNSALEALIAGGKLVVNDTLLTALIAGGRFATSNSALEALISSGKLLVSDAALDAIISGGKLATTNAVLEALISSGRLATSNSALEALISASKLAVTDATTQGKLDTIITNQGAASGVYVEQIGSIASGADSRFTSHTLVHGYNFKNLSASGESLYFSKSATPTATNSMVLGPGEWSCFLEGTNPNDWFIRSSSGSAGKSFVVGT